MLLVESIGHQLPFLLKCLSIRGALSIQAHPDEALAKQLHERSPDNYPDDQPKPEMAVAINSRFEALVGFVDISELISYVQNVPPFLENVVELEIYNQILHLGSMEPGRQKEKLVADVFRILVSKIMRLEQKRADDALDAIDVWFCENKDEIPPKKVFAKLYKEFPGDVGCLFAFLLNYVVLQPGESIFLSANEPHAYLSGDCIEIMHCSDNVVRAGLTPKFKDVETLMGMLSFTASSPKRFFVEPEPCLEHYSVVYRPPIPNFSLEKITVNKEHVKEFLFKQESLFMCVEGNAYVETDGSKHKLELGCAFYMPPESRLHVMESEGLVLFRAFRPDGCFGRV